MDRHPEVIGLHMLLGDQVSRLDQLETRTWNARGGGLYIAPESSDAVASNVVLTLAYLSLEGRP